MPIIALLIMALAVLAGTDAFGQSTASCTASCTIVSPIHIQNLSPLQFGYLSVSPTDGGTVTVTASGERASDGAVTLYSGAWAPARFHIAGEAGASYVVRLPASCTIRRLGGSDPMLVDSFGCSPDVQGQLTGGAQSIGVGATLHVNPGQPPGTYIGTFEVTVAYQ